MKEKPLKHSSLEYIKLIFSIDKRLIFILTFDIILDLIYYLIPIGIIGYLSDIYLKEPTDSGFKKVLILLTIYAIIKVIISGINMIVRNELTGKSYRFINNYCLKQLYGKVQTLDYETYQSNEFLNIYQKACDESSDYMYNVFWNVDSFICSLCSIFGIGVILSFINPIIIVYSLIICVLLYILTHKKAKINYALSDKNMQNVRKRAYVKRVFYLKDASIDVKTSNISNMYLNENDEISTDIIKNVDKYMTKTTFLGAAEIFLMRSIYIVALAFVAYKANLTSDLVLIASLISAASSLSELITGISNDISYLKENIIHRTDYYRVMDKTSCLESTGHIDDLDDLQTLEFKNVYFKYPHQDKYSLKDINLTLKQKEHIAVVGENGAGKTTLIKLILRLYDPEDGDIYYNNLNYKDIVPSVLRNKFVSVFQNYQIYAVSVAENILLRKLEVEEDELLVIEALKKVGLDKKVMALKDGINTIVTKEFDKEGLELSGGERQKLVIARIFASSAKILILDEPNSALDPLAEKHIFDEIFEYAIDKTLIFISHRFSTTIKADKIYLFDDGQIKESGTHTELMNLKQEYMRMFNIQAENYQNEVNNHED